MENFFQPTVLLPVFMTIVILGLVALGILRKMRDKELECHQEMRIREIEHQVKMKQLEIDLEKARGRIAGDKVA